MIRPLNSPANLPDPGARGSAPGTERLGQTAKQLEGLFVRQLFAAMRSTVPEGGVVDGGPGEEMFTGMLHEQIADELPSQWSRGIARDIVLKLQSRVDNAGASGAADAPGSHGP
jgi:peptidoglycan hydrolase FlgJ